MIWVGGADDLDQYPPGAVGVDEEVGVAPGAEADGVVDEADAVGLEAGEGGGKVVGVKGDVVEAFAAAGEEAGDGGCFGGGFEELEAGVTEGEHGGADLLVGDFFGGGDVEAEQLVEGAGGCDGVDGDAEMIEFWGTGEVFAHVCDDIVRYTPLPPYFAQILPSK